MIPSLNRNLKDTQTHSLTHSLGSHTSGPSQPCRIARRGLPVKMKNTANFNETRMSRVVLDLTKDPGPEPLSNAKGGRKLLQLPARTGPARPILLGFVTGITLRGPFSLDPLKATLSGHLFFVFDSLTVRPDPKPVDFFCAFSLSAAATTIQCGQTFNRSFHSQLTCESALYPHTMPCSTTA